MAEQGRPKFKRRPHEKDRIYLYEEHDDCHLCPRRQELSYRTTTKEGYLQFPFIVKNVRFYLSALKAKTIRSRLNTMFGSNKQKKLIIYARRKESIEQVFTDVKEKDNPQGELKIVHEGDG